MSRITPHQLSGLAAAGVYATFAAHVLSDFERETLATVCERAMRFGPDTVITEPEWEVCRACVNAMDNLHVATWEIIYDATDGSRGKPRWSRKGGRA